jgi:hypothetical protein
MGRSIPSFRQLIEIERLNWFEFKKALPTKNDRIAFDAIFENATLYTQYLSNANRPIPIEPIMIGAMFHNYKTLLKLWKDEDNITEDYIEQILVKIEREKPLVKMLFDKTCKRRGLLYALHKGDREQLLRMLVNCCNSLDDWAAKKLIDNYSESSVSILFLFCLVLQNQKLINGIKKSLEKDVKTDVNLLDFIDSSLENC